MAAISFRQFVELLLARLEAADAQVGGGQFIDLRELAREFADDIPDVWVWQAAEIMDEDGLAKTIRTMGGNAAATITGRGRLFLEDGGNSGVLAVYRTDPQRFVKRRPEPEAPRADVLRETEAKSKASREPGPPDPSQPSVFLSHAHEDKQLARALYNGLTSLGLRVWIDEVELRVGDSLIERISTAIAEGDFLLAIVSPASLQSSWCQRELALAATKGINQKRVTVLPIRYRQAPLPPTLADRVWLDADALTIDALVSRLARDIALHRAEIDDPALNNAAQSETSSVAVKAADIAIAFSGGYSGREGWIDFPVGLTNDGTRIARGVVVRGYLDDEQVAETRRVDVPVEAAPVIVQIPLRRPDQAQLAPNHRPVFHGRRFSATAEVGGSTARADWPHDDGPSATESPSSGRLRNVGEGLVTGLAAIDYFQDITRFRQSFDLFIDTFLERRREVTEGHLSRERINEIRDEYRTHQRAVAGAYDTVRERYERFLGEMPEYARLIDPDDIYLNPADVIEPNIRDWWAAITFQDALVHWANADDDHLDPYIDRQRAVLDAFHDWARRRSHRR